MPNARTHDVITVVTGLALAPAAYAILINQGQSSEIARVNSALFAGAHLLSGIMFSPDLDIDSKIDDRWWIFHWIWRPYMWVMPHGHRFSHGLVVSPLLRLVYFISAVFLILLGAAWALGQVGIVMEEYHLRMIDYLQELARTRPREIATVVVGFITGSAAHSIADWVTKDKK